MRKIAVYGFSNLRQKNYAAIYSEEILMKSAVPLINIFRAIFQIPFLCGKIYAAKLNFLRQAYLHGN